MENLTADEETVFDGLTQVADLFFFRIFGVNFFKRFPDESMPSFAFFGNLQRARVGDWVSKSEIELLINVVPKTI